MSDLDVSNLDTGGRPKVTDLGVLRDGRRVRAHDLLQAAARAGGVDVDRMKGADRTRRIARGRQRVCWILNRIRHDMSLNQIGVAIGRRDHSTVSYAIDTVDERLAGIGRGALHMNPPLPVQEREAINEILFEAGTGLTIDDLPPPASREFYGGYSTMYRLARKADAASDVIDELIELAEKARREAEARQTAETQTKEAA